METKSKVHLQGIGLVNAKPAGEFIPGDVTVWNYGYTNRVISVERKGCFVTFTLESNDPVRNGPTHTRRKGVNTLIAFAKAKPVLGMIAGEELPE